MRHIQRTHRIDLDWLFERFRIYPGLYMRFIGTKEQIADKLAEFKRLAESRMVNVTPDVVSIDHETQDIAEDNQDTAT